MTTNGLIQFTLFWWVLLACVPPLGRYMARVYLGQRHFMSWLFGPVERVIYRLTGVDATTEMSWREYARAVLVFNFLGFLTVYLLQRLQGVLPLNPEGLSAVSPDSAMNTAISFATNTNWQGYGGESTMSYLTQMAALAVQNFLSAACGMAVLVALVRGLTRQHAETIGNFWVDVVRGTVHILLPLSFVLALFFVSQGVVQTFSPYHEATLLEPLSDADGNVITTQKIAVGPVASQLAIKQLGTNGGGFFNVNSAHPLENPTPLSNFIQLLAILVIPASLCYTFGEMVNDRRQGWAILLAMCLVLVPLMALTMWAEQQGNPALNSLNVDQAAGNMEGKETRFGVVGSAMWATATTAASNGSVNAMHDSFTPIGGLIPMWLMQLGEVIFGGVGSGLYGMLLFAIVAVFLAGLMVGRTPEYLGKKIGAFEIKMASIAILMPCIMVLIGTAISLRATEGKATIFNTGPHGLSEVLYAFSSASNNNGSAFAGLGANTPFYNGLLGLAMLIGRFWVMLPVIALAGSLAHKKSTPAGAGTLPTHTPLFIVLLVVVVIVVGALSFFPALALGPIVEQVQLTRGQ